MNKLDVLSKINPQMKAVLAKEDELAGDANDTSVGFEKMRENYVAGRAFWCEGGPVMAEKLDAEVDGPYGASPVRYYYPTAAAAAGRAAGKPAMPAIVYVHGGGFVLGNLDTHDRVCRVLASHAGVPVVAVDYRLSPEAKFPSAVEEVAAVASYLHEQGARHGIDGERLSFAGDSGGAHLGLAATMYLREEKGASDFVKCCLLYYGWFGLTDSSSMRLLGGPWDGLTEADWQFYMQMYANDPAELAASPYATCRPATSRRPSTTRCATTAPRWQPSASSTARPSATRCSKASSTRFCTTPRCSMRQTTPSSTARPSTASSWGCRRRGRKTNQGYSGGSAPLHKH